MNTPSTRAPIPTAHAQAVCSAIPSILELQTATFLLCSIPSPLASPPVIRTQAGRGE